MWFQLHGCWDSFFFSVAFCYHWGSVSHQGDLVASFSPACSGMGACVTVVALEDLFHLQVLFLKNSQSYIRYMSNTWVILIH